MTLNVGGWLRKLFGEADPVEKWLRGLLVATLATLGDGTVGTERQIGTTRVKLLSETWRVRLLAERES